MIDDLIIISSGCMAWPLAIHLSPYRNDLTPQAAAHCDWCHSGGYEVQGRSDRGCWHLGAGNLGSFRTGGQGGGEIWHARMHEKYIYIMNRVFFLHPHMPFILLMFGAATAQNTQVGDVASGRTDQTLATRMCRSAQQLTDKVCGWTPKGHHETGCTSIHYLCRCLITRIPLFRAIFCTFKNNQKLNEMVAMTSSYATLLYHCMLNLSGCWIIITIYPGQSYHMEFRNFYYLQKERNFPNHFWRFQLS